MERISMLNICEQLLKLEEVKMMSLKRSQSSRPALAQNNVAEKNNNNSTAESALGTGPVHDQHCISQLQVCCHTLGTTFSPSIFSLWKQNAFPWEGKPALAAIRHWHFQADICALHKSLLITNWLDFRTVGSSYKKETILSNAALQVLWKSKGQDEAQTYALLYLNTETVQAPIRKIFNEFEGLKDRGLSSGIKPLPLPNVKK